MNKPKVLIVVNDSLAGGVQMRAKYIQEHLGVDVISRQNIGDMGFKVIEDIKERIELINTYDIVSFETDGGSDIPELPYCKNITIETIHSLQCSDHQTTMKFGMSDSVSLVQKYPCITIYPGIDFERIKKVDKAETKKKFGLPTDIPIVGRIGRVVFEKGLEDFVQVCKVIKNVYYLSLGDGDALPYLYDKMQENGNTWNHIGSKDMSPAEFWSVVDVLLYPTYDESFCNVWFEAMYSGVPIVTRNITVANEFNIQIRCNSVEEEALALRNIIGRPDLKEALIKHGQDIVKNMDMKERIKELSKWYILLGENK